jgi:hypothetical protein|tara:strand:- start:4614 stop:7133 length:2520 start_codon:yes stop_codon:yes gene_type:complete
MVKTTTHRFGALVTAFVLLVLTGGPALADEQSWPTKISFEQGSMLIYQPQIESLQGNRIEARAAISIRQGSPEATPVFAAIRFSALTDSTASDAVLTVRDLEMVDLQFGDADVPEQEELIQVVEQQLAGITLDIANDHGSIAANGEAGSDDPQGLLSDPPRIILSKEPAILVPIDGEPRLQAIEGTEMQWVVNSQTPIIERQQVYYLYAGGLWYSSADVLGEWSVSELVPDEVRQVVEAESEEDSEDIDPVSARIIVATEPTELIVSDGDPSWSPVEGMDLLFMANTESNVFLHLESGDHFLLLGGRWFRGSLKQTDVDWKAVANDALPSAFAEIVEDSRRSEVLAHVAGTPQAREAVLQNSLPQTTAIRRDEASFEAEWDGEPKFETVQILDQHDEVLYAINTVDSVFKVGDTYYACEEGVWYESHSAFGPWMLATTIPAAIYAIPPSNPHHRVTYVRIYDVTPDVVYVGYTPGYLGSYTYHGSVVYGTGYRYDPWYGSYFYPRRLTWGLSPFYDPWFGWNSGLVSLHWPLRFNFGHGSRHHRHLKPSRRGRARPGRDRNERHERRRNRDYGSGFRRDDDRISDRRRHRTDLKPARRGAREKQRDFNRRENIARLRRVEPERQVDAEGKQRRRFDTQRSAITDVQPRRAGTNRASSRPRPARRRSVEPVVDANQQRAERSARIQPDANTSAVEPAALSSREAQAPAGRAIRRERRLAGEAAMRGRGDVARPMRSDRNRQLREPSRDRQITRTGDAIQNRTRDAVKRTLPRATPRSTPRSQSNPRRAAPPPARTRTAAVKKSANKPADHSRRSDKERSSSRPHERHSDRPRRASKFRPD